MPGPQAAKSEATRERILGAAHALFGEKGFAGATMREIADRAGCSLGLAYRYYRSKDAMAVALYERLQDEFAEEAARIEPGRLGRRWGQAMRAEMARLAPHRGMLIGMTGAALAPGSATQVLGPESAGIRRRMIGLFHDLIGGARDLPRSADVSALATLFYGLHLLLIFFWLQDPTPGQAATAQLIRFTEESLAWSRVALRLPGVSAALARLAGIFGPIFDGSAEASG